MEDGNPRTASPLAASPSLAFLPVFVDTSLGTHLAMVFSPLDTVADLKRKIEAEHAVCFPVIGGIAVQAVKLKRRACFYHLSDSMLVRSAFDGKKGSWFLQIDALPTSVTQGHIGTAENFLNVEDGLSARHQRLQTAYDVTSLPIEGEDRSQRFLVNESSQENNHIVTNTGSVSKKLILPDDNDVNTSNHVELGAKAKHSKQKIPLVEVEERPDCDAPERKKAVNKSIEAVNVEPNAELAIDQQQKADRDECKDPGITMSVEGTSDNANKDVKSRKRKNVVENNHIGQKNSEDIPGERKKHTKRGKGASFEKPVEDAVTRDISKISHDPKGTSKVVDLKNISLGKHGEPDSLEVSASEAVHHDSLLVGNPNEKKEKKRKKQSSKLHDGVNAAVPSDAATGRSASRIGKTNVETGLASELLDMPDASVPPQQEVAEPISEKSDHLSSENHHNHLVSELITQGASFEEPVKNSVTRDKSKTSHGAKETSKVVDPKTSSGKHEENPVSLKTSASDTVDHVLALDENPSDKKEKKKKKRSSKLQNEVNAVVPSDTVTGRSPFRRKKTAETRLASGLLDITGVSASPQQEVAESMPEKSSKDYHNRSVSELVTEENLADPSANPDENFNAATEHRNGTAQDIPVEENIQPTKSSHSRKKIKHVVSKKVSNKNDASSKFVSEERTLQEMNCNNHNDPSKSHGVAGAETFHPTMLVKRDSADSLNARNLHQKEKTKLSNCQSKHYESFKTAEDQVVKENASGVLQNSQDVGSKGPEDETKGLGSVSVVALGANEKKPRRSKKKSAKVELLKHEVTGNENVEPLENEVTVENIGESLGTTHNGLGNEKDIKSSTADGEAASVETPAVDLVISSDSHGKKTHGQRKKSGKRDHSHGPSLGSDLNVAVDQSMHKDSAAGPTESNGTVKNVFLQSMHTDSDAPYDVSHKTYDGFGQEDEPPKDSEKETAANATSKANGELPKVDTETVNFMKYFAPEVDQNESAVSKDEPQAMKTETRKSHQEKSKGKINSNAPPKVSSSLDTKNISRSNEDHLFGGKLQETNSTLNDLADALEQFAVKENKKRKADKTKNLESAGKIKANLSNDSSKLVSPSNSHDKNRPGKKRTVSTTDMQNEVSMSRVEPAERPKRKQSVSGSNAKYHSSDEGNDYTKPKNEVSQPNNVNTVPVTQNPSTVGSDMYHKEEGMENRVASDDSTEEDTPNQKIRYKVAVRKVPSKKQGKLLDNSRQKSNVESMTTTIFYDTASESSDDQFEFRNRKITAEDNSFTSADLDEDRANSPEVEPAGHDKDNKGVVDGDINLSQSANTARKSVSLKTLLRSSSSYKKAKLIASQSQPDDSESQAVDVVFETQPE